VGPVVDLDNLKSVIKVNMENIRGLDLYSVKSQLNHAYLKDNFIGRVPLCTSFWLKFLPDVD
jgi:uncharacterized membrane protein (Fun14 family)